MSKTLKIAPNLSLPLEAVTQTFAIMAKRGTGKTHTASVLAEEMLKQGQPIVVYDPTSAWWGLKSSVDGKRAGFPVVIFGGEHADVPLEETAGETIARVIVEKRLPAILDVGQLRKGARIRFMTDFCETLYHRNREALHFFIDEAQTVAPQNLRAMPEIARLVGALEDILLQGRRRGIGATVISPRPAIVNTSIRSACEVLIAMQIVGPHDRKAIQEWIDLHGDDADRAKEMLASLASLKRGEAWIWSPSWLELFTRTKFRDRETFDSSATPKVGGHVVAPQKVAAIDLAALGAEIAATVARVKADDPKELRKRLAAAEAELAAAKRAQPAPAPQTIEKPVEVSVLTDADRKRLDELLAALHASVDHVGAKIGDAIDRALVPYRKQAGTIESRLAPIVAKMETARLAAPVRTVVHQSAPVRTTVYPSAPATNGGPSPKGDRAILVAIAQQPGIDRTNLTLLTGYKRSTRDAYLQRLSARGMIAAEGAGFTMTDAGLAELGHDYQPLPTGDALRQHWFGKLPEGERRCLEVVCAGGPNGTVDRNVVTDETGYKRSTRDAYLQRLAARKLVIPDDRGAVRPSAALFG